MVELHASPAVRALVTALQRVCAALPDAEQYVMVHHPAFRVGKKPFAIAGLGHETGGALVSINLGPDAQAGLLGDPRFTRTPYIGQHGWVSVPAAEVGADELAALVTASWRRIAGARRLAAFDARAQAPAPVAKVAKVRAGTRASKPASPSRPRRPRTPGRARRA